MRRNRAVFPIVGIGASAGGIEALEGFFRGVPENPGMAFIVVTHLNPERQSFLHQIIARYTQMAVTIARDGLTVEPNCVYVRPPEAILTIHDRRLRMQTIGVGQHERKPIDIFLGSLAQDCGKMSAAVVLSGGDGDGTLGVKAIKIHGGLTLAQVADGHGPSMPDMPDSAIATGLVDIAVPVDQMGKQIAAFIHSPDVVEDSTADPDENGIEPSVVQARQDIYTLLRNQTGHDFSGYKVKTFMRRVYRRMQISLSTTLETYVEQLRQNPKELAALFRDLLIKVTSFFRDSDAFDKLNEIVIPKLFENRVSNDTIRIWVPGCATGEEVFSLAMLLREYIEAHPSAPRAQIFATDIDEIAIGVARAGRYPEALLEGVSPERREKYFMADGGGFVLSKDIRDLCVFSPHSIIRDPPFSRMDLVSCRNLLIYFSIDTQNQVVPIFHYSLRPGGYLFLGMSENVSQFSDLFVPLEKKERIFRRREDSSSSSNLALVANHLIARNDSGDADQTRIFNGGSTIRQIVESQILDRFAPAHVVINRDGNIVHFSARTGKYLENSVGSPNRQLITMARKGLRVDLRAAIREAIDNGRRVIREHLSVVGDDDRIQTVNLIIEPISNRNADDQLYLVIFTDEGPSLTREDASARGKNEQNTDKADVERELRDTRERLQALVEEYETALEELKSANEELVSVNEELQSSNEELEASKEELQSLNEELNTVNAELHNKIDALDCANSDLKNLFETTQIATVFLDKNLSIRSFTPAVSRIFNILPSDHGRPLTDLSSRFPLPDLGRDVQEIIANGTEIERHIDADSKRIHYLIRGVPYLSEAGKIDGVVLTFVDVTNLTLAEEHQRVLIAELNHRVKNMLGVVLSIADQTLKSAPSMDSFKTKFVARLQAMARSYELLSRESWTEASIQELIQLEIEPFGPGRVTANGPAVKLGPKQALSTGMILHELATNAGKYGALTLNEGRVDIHWNVSSGGKSMALEWRESKGPKVLKPEQFSFGLKLVERETTYNLGGKSEINFLPGGLLVRIEWPYNIREAT